MKKNRDEIKAGALACLDEKRIPHVLGCEKAALCLAERWNTDAADASVAALLHDCTKRLSYEEHVEIITQSGVSIDSSLLNEPKLLHAVTGAIVAVRDFSVPEHIAGSIRWHTTGKPDMSMLEKIIYLADYIEETRDFDGVELLRKLSFTDIDMAMTYGLEMSINYVRAGGREPHHDSVSAYEYYKNIK